MEGLRKRMKSMNFYLNSKGKSMKNMQTIKASEKSMTAGRMTSTLDKTKETQTSRNIKSNI